MLITLTHRIVKAYIRSFIQLPDLCRSVYFFCIQQFNHMYKKNLKIAIVGSRSFNDYECLCQVIAKHLSPSDKIDCVISGGAKGADSLSERYAREHGYPIKIYPAEWKLHGPAAGYIRNVDVINACDICFAFWDGGSKGTFDAMRLCEELGKPYHIYYFKKPVQGQIYQQARQLSI